MTITTILEWTGALLGLSGAALLAAHHRYSGWGFLAFLISNLCWIGFAVLTSAFGLLVMQLGFMLTSVLGFFRWVLMPPVPYSRKK
ncbi:hypothetical protein PT7_0309 [Pusillimonas sp. T7-7]|uniref:hypothetical protein n=1 Tax=Pusillimonas sp. (strain T7-7) TaxID=1007105 RepID=UPI0002084C40|nr:hypothetical protein [Pusillimonas sp. T7-7]AEC18849.1 hypothetical protein PT7_0309 [Pusillimonas sp. T7-7]